MFKQDDILANSVGLKELIRLKHNDSIEYTRIDLITSSGLQLKEAILISANLEGAVYNDDTEFPEGFDPKKKGMILVFDPKKKGMILV